MRFFNHILASAAVMLALGSWTIAQEDYSGQTVREPALGQVQTIKVMPPLILEQQRLPEIKLTETVNVGDLRLEPGEYLVRFHRKGSNHFIRFTRVETVVEVHPEFSVNTYSYDVGEVKCDMVPLPGKASRTLVSVFSQHDVERIARIEIKGDSVVHVL